MTPEMFFQVWVGCKLFLALSTKENLFSVVEYFMLVQRWLRQTRIKANSFLEGIMFAPKKGPSLARIQFFMCYHNEPNSWWTKLTRILILEFIKVGKNYICFNRKKSGILVVGIHWGLQGFFGLTGNFLISQRECNKYNKYPECRGLQAFFFYLAGNFRPKSDQPGSFRGFSKPVFWWLKWLNQITFVCVTFLWAKVELTELAVELLELLAGVFQGLVTGVYIMDTWKNLTVPPLIFKMLKFFPVFADFFCGHKWPILQGNKIRILSSFLLLFLWFLHSFLLFCLLFFPLSSFLSFKKCIPLPQLRPQNLPCLNFRKFFYPGGGGG